MATFETVWRQVRLSVPGAPVFLVREWVQDAYRSVHDKRLWNFSLIQDQIAWADSRDNLTNTVTWGSTAVTGNAGTPFVAADAGRQWRVGSYPIYTIQSVSLAGATSAVLDLPYRGETTGVVTTAQVLDAYATMPANFGQFMVVTDPQNQRFIPWWATQTDLTLVDPTRASSASVPRLLVGRKGSTYPPTLGQVQYEYWPKPTAQGAFQYYAKAAPVALADTDTFTGVLAHRTDVLVTGALMRAAQWPGTADLKNPYFNLALARQLQDDFERDCVALDIRDDDVYAQSFDTIPWQRWSNFAWAYDTHLLQATDATLADYAGYLGGGGW